MAVVAALAPLAPQMKQTAILENLGSGRQQVQDLLALFVDGKSGRGHSEKVTESVHQAFQALQGLNEAPELERTLAQLANCPVGREIGEQLARELPTVLASLNSALLRRQYRLTDKSMAELGVLQARRLQEAWTEIKGAQQLSARAAATIIPEIDLRLRLMETEYCVKIKKFIAATESPQFSPAQRANIVEKVKTLYIALRSEYSRVTADINNLKLEIAGQEIRLRHQDKLQTDLMVQNAVIGIVGVAKNGYADNWSAAAEVAGAAVGNILESWHTKVAIGREISKLETIFAQVQALEVRLAEVAQVKALAEEFLRANGVNLAQLQKEG